MMSCFHLKHSLIYDGCIRSICSMSLDIFKVYVIGRIFYKNYKNIYFLLLGTISV
jgi:hypothetical protein